ncbi:PIR Superfamily Protein [Plasmodium ovale wallikeri]|uniref:PIR Superfamily Protein n=1 Tax=Plasmodium ovale wallikeri TaxID=864142 RepID=A0A1A9ADU8_PLAOA|nr:PIR Superfamily Protein [Plasmodium ovale wallikeri]SBT57864.1 PIR Superfamily Protein [Plasmodium ovale wallikeri]
MSKTITYTLNKFAEEDSEFKNGSLYILYNKFMNSCTPDEDEIFKYEHCSLEQYEGILNSSLIIFINKVLTNLKRISNNKLIFSGGIDFDEKKVCTNFKYWFFDQILDKEFNDDHIEKLFENLDEKKGNFVKANCEFYPMKLCDIMIMKKIYNYYAFYHAYNGEQEKIIKEISKSKYCENIKNGIIYSDYYDSTCSRSPYNNKSICKEFNNYIKNHIKFEKYKLSSIKCAADQSPLIEDNQLEYKFPEDKQLLVDEDTEVNSQTTEDPGLTGSSMATVLPVSFVGTFSVLFLLYKFTPFRSFLNPQIQRMKNLWKNEDQETEELLINNYETEDFDSENKEYNITYHSY